MEINIGMSECHKNVDNYYGSHIAVWFPRCAGREAFDGVEPLHGFNKIFKTDNVQCLGGSPGHHFSKNLVCKV